MLLIVVQSIISNNRKTKNKNKKNYVLNPELFTQREKNKSNSMESACDSLMKAEYAEHMAHGTQTVSDNKLFATVLCRVSEERRKNHRFGAARE